MIWEGMRRVLERVAVIGIVLVSACATVGQRGMEQPPITDIPQYREQVLRDQMDPAKLPEKVRATVQVTAPRAFSRMVVTYESTREENGRSELVSGQETIVSTGDGLFKQQEEWSSNGLPYRINTRLTYAGIVPLRSETMFTNHRAAEPGGCAVDVSEAAPGVLHPEPGRSYEFRYVACEKGQPVARTRTCKAGSPTQASGLHPGLGGLAFELACELKTRGVATETSRFVMLEQYGLALQIERVAAHVKEPRRIVDVAITR